MIEIKTYGPDLISQWNQFIDSSKNGTFLLRRDFMDYHADRFTDRSLLFYRDNKILGVLPASQQQSGASICSHGGLTYGGLILDSKATLTDTWELFDSLIDYMRTSGIGELIYKPTPYIYHRTPADEDLYCLFARCNATLVRRDISSVIDLHHPYHTRRIRLCGAKNAKKAGISCRISTDFDSFWDILDDTLIQRHGVHPVHTKHELNLLANRFPHNIILAAAFSSDDKMIAGTVLFMTDTCLHAQYIAANETGRQHGALDMLFINILNGVIPIITTQTFFDFGRSTEGNGREFNANLLYQKEGFGARGVCYDTYTIKI